MDDASTARRTTYLPSGTSADQPRSGDRLRRMGNPPRRGGNDHHRDRGRPRCRSERPAHAPRSGTGSGGRGGGRRCRRRETLRPRPQAGCPDSRPQHAGEPSLSAIPQLREEFPATQIVVLTMQDDPAFAREAMRAGALGYVLKEAADAELVEAVRGAAHGTTYLHPRLGARLAAEAIKEPADSLTERERRC